MTASTVYQNMINKANKNKVAAKTTDNSLSNTIGGGPQVAILAIKDSI